MKDLLDRFEAKAPEIVFEWHDAETEAKGWAVINSLRGGAAGGGTRMRAGLDRAEVEALAKTMEVKFTVSGPAIGGAKSGIDFDPRDPRRAGVLERWFRAVTPLLKTYSGLWVTAWSAVPGTVGLLLFSGAELLTMDWQSFSGLAWFAIFFAAIPVTVFSLLVWYLGIERLGANQVMVYMYLVPPASIAIAYFTIGEQISFLQLVGGAVAMLGLYWVKRAATTPRR